MGSVSLSGIGEEFDEKAYIAILFLVAWLHISYQLDQDQDLLQVAYPRELIVDRKEILVQTRA